MDFLSVSKKGIKLLSENKPEEAVEQFKIVIQNAKDGDLLVQTHINLASAYLAQYNIIDGMNEIDTAIGMIGEPKEKPAKKMLNNARIVRSQLLQAEGNVYKAVSELQGAKTSECTREAVAILSKLNLHHLFDQRDPLLEPFSAIADSLMDEQKVEAASARLPLEGNFVKLEARGCVSFAVGLVMLYNGNETIVGNVLKFIEAAARNQCKSTWVLIEAYDAAIKKHSKNHAIFGSICRIFSDIPQSETKRIATTGFLDIFIGSMLENVDDCKEDIDLALKGITDIASSPSLIEHVASDDIVNVILKMRTDQAFLLYSKLYIVTLICIVGFKNGSIDWILSVLCDETKPLEMISAAVVMLDRSMIAMGHYKHESDLPQRVIPKFAALLAKYSKNPEVVSPIFAGFSIALEFDPQELTKMRIPRLASTLLSIHKSDENVVQNIVAFVFSCYEKGIWEEFTKVPVLFDTLFSLFNRYVNNEMIAERLVALGYITNQPNKESMKSIACLKFKNSEIIKKYSQ